MNYSNYQELFADRVLLYCATSLQIRVRYVYTLYVRYFVVPRFYTFINVFTYNARNVCNYYTFMCVAVTHVMCSSNTCYVCIYTRFRCVEITRLICVAITRLICVAVTHLMQVDIQ